METKIKVIVLHEYYGCETGCWGHAVRIADDERAGTFGFEFFEHPEEGDDFQEWAKNFAQEAVEKEYGPGHVADLDWENCKIVVDC